MDAMNARMGLRPATSALCRWDDEPHVIASDPNSDWDGEANVL